MSGAATTFYLVRHASHDWLARGIAGRMPGVDLNPAGRREAARLAGRLGGVALQAVYCSPLERTRQTALPLAEQHKLPLLDCPEALEIDFGEWTGLPFQELNNRPGWNQWNTFRSHARPPGGEAMAEVQARLAGLLQRLAAEHAGGRVAVVTHGDVIRAGLAYYCGMPLDLMLRLEISPASVSLIEINSYGPKILKVNDTGQLD